ncbi:MAG TPA: T9SS type A sorting domain-containing protein, partial [Lacibacter sp.]|nr:T9SS type A sorting domain-containing protein [Lacibacter sp.]
YRLKMIDTDGKFTYSHIIMMRKSSAGLKGLSLAPNPVVSSTATARVDVSSSTTVTLRVMDLSGKLVLQQKNAVAAGVNSIPVLNVQQLQPGTYVLQLINGDEIQSVRFTVAR